jgi:hypothetical protein
MAGVYARARGAAVYACPVPRSWIYSMAILVVALLASMVIAAIKLF